jgi:hypothetical protein
VTHGGLAKIQPLSGKDQIAVLEYCVEYTQEIKVDPAEVHIFDWLALQSDHFTRGNSCFGDCTAKASTQEDMGRVGDG